MTLITEDPNNKYPICNDPIIYTDYGTLKDPNTKLKNENDPITKNIANFMKNSNKISVFLKNQSFSRKSRKTVLRKFLRNFLRRMILRKFLRNFLRRITLFTGIFG